MHYYSQYQPAQASLTTIAALRMGANQGKNNFLSPFKKDIESYVKDEYYKAGWNDGHAKCKADYEELGKALGF